MQQTVQAGMALVEALKRNGTLERLDFDVADVTWTYRDTTAQGINAFRESIEQNVAIQYLGSQWDDDHCDRFWPTSPGWMLNAEVWQSSDRRLPL